MFLYSVMAMVEERIPEKWQWFSPETLREANS